MFIIKYFLIFLTLILCINCASQKQFMPQATENDIEFIVKSGFNETVWHYLITEEAVICKKFTTLDSTDYSITSTMLDSSNKNMRSNVITKLSIIQPGNFITTTTRENHNSPRFTIRFRKKEWFCFECQDKSPKLMVIIDKISAICRK